MSFLKKLIVEYLNCENRIIFSDYENSYSAESFKEKVNFFFFF